MRAGRVFGFVAAALLCGAAVVIGAAAKFSRHVQPGTDASGAATQSRPADSRAEVELLTIRHGGFDPAEIKRPPGPFVVLIENTSGLDLGPLRLVPDEDANPGVSRLLEANAKRGQPSIAWRVELPPGGYTLRQVNQPGWSCRITVAPR